MPLVPVDIDSIPTVHTEDVVMLISDSGTICCRVEAKCWDVFSNKGDSYTYLPEGVYVERFDSLLHIIGTIAADTAYYFEKKELWQAIGNVVVKNMEGRVFETSELFWNQKAPSNAVNAFYTDKPVKITEPDGGVSYGRNGFKADQSLNIIRLFSMAGDFNMEESADTLRRDTINTDSIQLP